MKIKDLAIGTTASIIVLVKAAEIKKTGGGKPFLSATFTDGTHDITGVKWDYHSDAPAKNAIMNVAGSVGEYNGNKQLNIQSLTYNNETSSAYFVPKGNFDLDEYITRVKYLIEEVKNEKVKDILNRAFKENSALWKTIPSAKGVHHAFVAGNLKHSVDVAVKARAIALVTENANVDLCIAGGLLQDLGKLWTYRLNGAVIEMTLQGQLIEHIAIGMIKLEEYRTPMNTDVIDILQHLISSHHGTLEYGSPTLPQTLEALIVSVADGLDARTQIIQELNERAKLGDIQTDKSYYLNNKQMLTYEYINKIMSE